MMITWIDGISQNPKNIDVNKMMRQRPDYQRDEISVKYGKDGKATFPKNCLIESPNERTEKIDDNLKVGNVVKHKLSDEEMCITWIVGQETESESIINLNKLYQMQGFNYGDIVCGFFENKKYQTKLMKKEEVE